MIVCLNAIFFSVLDGWRLVKRFLNNQISFVQAEEEIKQLFGPAGNNLIWQKIGYINDLDPDELLSQQLSLAQEIDTQIQRSIEVEQATQAVSPMTVSDNNIAYDTNNNEEIRFLLFRVRCFVSWMLFYLLIRHMSENCLEVF